MTAAVNSLAWAADGRALAFEEDEAIHVIEVATGQRRVVVRQSALEELSESVPEPERFEWRNRRVREEKIQWFPSGDELLISVEGDLFRVPVNGVAPAQLTATPAEEFDPKISPNGRRVSFVRERELWVVDVGSGKETRLTRNATATRWNATLDWVYPEELDLPTAHWWSPDGRWIAYLQFDVSAQETYPHADLLEVRAVAEPQWYPKAGTANAKVRLGVVAPRGGRTRWLSVEGNSDTLLARVYWLPESKELAAIRMNRLQNHLELVAAPVRGGEARVLLTETDPHWINLGDDFQPIEGRDQFLWTSERGGCRHIYLYGLDGTFGTQLTSGEWEVASSEAVDTDRIYFVSTEESPLERHLYWVGLDGGERRKVTEVAGLHSIDMAPEGGAWVDSFSSLTQPPSKTLRDREGNRIAVVEEPDRS
ncbi:MAG: hypothetical protein GY953_42560, partial [bacterium]|nr:hypothetical protein [bacterium]